LFTLFFVNFIEITLLVQAFLPVAFCLQETHLKKSDNINLKNYSVYSTYVDEDERAAGGSTIQLFPLSVVVLLPHKELCPLKSPMMMNGVGN
jgi:hypothetical protein